ncbi:hypothetical protein [Alkalitalea saponilacus]|uniref:Uncharacterized protein n=1 Tax=Alkalitalea saponilacus TaxID=889453 RepID=A0A1T5H844_9BACT|nr:hypothetical protein [Alkalitalea saponilacus]ASB50852.1 hypothetical protein CDL62_17685 [Alkalitalea saponilacus]SKC16711.1 hypothetical protein SAMN03080601_02123 [Alkalitalea saponilacus]
MLKKSIQLGTGIGKLKFGMTRKEVVSIIGEPNEIEEFTPDETNDTGNSIAWHYDELELSASFDEEDNWRLTSLAVSSPDYLFEDINLIGLSQEEVMQQIEMMDLGDIELEDLSDEDLVNQQVGSIPDVSLNLWFEDGILTEIQWGPYWDDEDESYIWP